MQMVIPFDHGAAGVAQPGHQGPLGDTIIHTDRTKIMTEAVQPAMFEADLPLGRREFFGQRSQYILHQHAADEIGRDPAIGWAAKHVAISRTRQPF